MKTPIPTGALRTSISNEAHLKSQLMGEIAGQPVLLQLIEFYSSLGIIRPYIYVT
jgi:hypothetical protein